MAKYRKKPIVVEANQFLGFYHTPWPVGVQGDTQECYVVTAHGDRINLEKNDWVIAELNGQGYYPCKDEIFQATYEPVKEQHG